MRLTVAKSQLQASDSLVEADVVRAELGANASTFGAERAVDGGEALLFKARRVDALAVEKQREEAQPFPTPLRARQAQAGRTA